MDSKIRQAVNNLDSKDDKIRMDALKNMLVLTEKPVDWAYEVWDKMLEKLDHPNSYQRTIGIKMLCSLANSDPENRMAESLDTILAHTKDEKFITSRQCLQSIWQAAGGGSTVNREKIIAHLASRYRECTTEKHYNLLRLDIIQSLCNLQQQQPDDSLLKLIQELIAEEEEPKYRKKYEGVVQA